MIRPALACLCLALASTVQAQEVTELGSGAVLRALDKVTGQASDLQVATGETVSYGRLEIRLLDCRYPAGDRVGDAFASLDIRETGHAEPVFQGWMIASAPALSAMDHAQYDIWVIRCTIS
jgi:hypothetical protein